MVPQESQGGGGVAADVPARHELGDFAPALEEFFGSAAGLSPSVITRLTKQWQAEQRAFAERRLDDRDYVYIWADGIHFNVRLEEARLSFGTLNRDCPHTLRFHLRTMGDAASLVMSDTGWLATPGAHEAYLLTMIACHP